MPKILVCGVINWDVTLFVERLPSPGEEVRVTRTIQVPGGKGANTAVAAARIMGRGEVGMIGMLGSDDVAARQLGILGDEEGVDTSCVARHGQAGSGTAYVVVDSSGEDMIMTHMAANQMMTPEIISSPKVLEAVEQSSIVIVIDPPLDVAGALVAQAKRAGKTAIWSPALLARHGLAALVEHHLGDADYIFTNEQEAVALASSSSARKERRSTGDPRQACTELSDALGGKKKVVTTVGSRGCILCRGGRVAASVPAMDLGLLGLRAVSTVGAGDAFVGAFGAFRAKGHGDLESLSLASVAAALKTTREETRGSPRYGEVMQYWADGRVRRLYENVSKETA
jgi:ribokinase